MDNTKFMWGEKAIEAGRVFTPTAPIDEESLFAGRTEQVRLIIDVINQKGQHAILYGERGVGKTSLANILSSKLTSPGREILAVRVNCDSTDDFESAWKKMFERLEFRDWQLPLGFGRDEVEVVTTGAEILIDPPTPESIRRAIFILSTKYVPIFIFDEFDRLSSPSRRAFADTIKTLSDHAIDGNIILVGVADSVDQLIEEHQSVERALVQVRMPRMSVLEIDEIISRGMTTLEMTIQKQAKNRISVLAQGLPHYAHLLGLHAARAALDQENLEIKQHHVDSAIERAINGAQQSTLTDYEIAVRSPRADNLFSDVLAACAMAKTNELGFFAAQDVREPMRKITGKQYEIPSFVRHLNDFCEDKRGPILQKTGGKRRYRYRFNNPLLQPFIIMRGLHSGRILDTIFN